MKTHKKIKIKSLGIAMASFLGIVSISQAESFFSYSTKFICGGSDDSAGIVRGKYRTTINIHNPHFFDVRFQKKAVIAQPQREERGPISELVEEGLRPDEAISVDCRDIRNLFDPVVTGPIEGFLVIYVPFSDDQLPSPELDVVGVYNARPLGRNSGVSTLDIETVEPKRVERVSLLCEDAAFPQCGGECPPGTQCEADFALDVCACFPIPSGCEQSSFPECGGECPSGTQCEPDFALDVCNCSPIPSGCEQSSFPECGGECPPGTQCEPDFALDVCNCSPI